MSKPLAHFCDVKRDAQDLVSRFNGDAQLDLPKALCQKRSSRTSEIVEKSLGHKYLLNNNGNETRTREETRDLGKRREAKEHTQQKNVNLMGGPHAFPLGGNLFQYSVTVRAE